MYVPKRPKPFVSKQTRGETGRKKKPGCPTQVRQVRGPEQFYWREYVWQTKKEYRDRVRQLLLCLAGGGMRPPPPGGIKYGNTPPPSPIPPTQEVVRGTPMFQLIHELVEQHPNFCNWPNQLQAFRVTRADSRKAPPVLWGRFRGNAAWRRLDWMAMVHKRAPTPADRVHAALWHAVRDQLEPPPPVDAKRSFPCGRCGLNRAHVDGVRPSHGVPWDVVLRHYLDGRPLPRVEWVKRENSFRLCGAADDWRAYHAEASQLALRCETCRIEQWVTCNVDNNHHSGSTTRQRHN